MRTASCFPEDYVRRRLCYYVNHRKEVWARMRDIDQDYADYAHTRQLEQDRRPQPERGLWQVNYRYKYRSLLRGPHRHPGTNGLRSARFDDGLA